MNTVDRVERTIGQLDILRQRCAEMETDPMTSGQMRVKAGGQSLAYAVAGGALTSIAREHREANYPDEEMRERLHQDSIARGRATEIIRMFRPIYTRDEIIPLVVDPCPGKVASLPQDVVTEAIDDMIGAGELVETEKPDEKPGGLEWVKELEGA